MTMADMDKAGDLGNVCDMETIEAQAYMSIRVPKETKPAYEALIRKYKRQLDFVAQRAVHDEINRLALEWNPMGDSEALRIIGSRRNL